MRRDPYLNVWGSGRGGACGANVSEIGGGNVTCVVSADGIGAGGSNVSDGAASGRAVATGRGVGSVSGAPEGASGCDVASASGACEIYPCSGRAREV